MEWIWDDQPATAPRLLDELMADLRNRLKLMGLSRALVAARGQCKLNVPADVVDLHRFRKLVNAARTGDDEHAADQLRQALELSEDVPFAALPGERIDNFRVTVLDERKSARVEYAEVALRLRRETQVLPDLAELNRADPRNERIVGLLMRALNQSGDPGRAGEVFRRLRKQIKEELGVDVGKEIAELNQRIIERDPSLLPPRKEEKPNQMGANMPNAGESAQAGTELYATGAKHAFGAGSSAAENVVVNITHASNPPWPGTGAKEVRTGDKNADAGGKTYENVIFNGYPG